jgi:hypothetical protein
MTADIQYNPNAGIDVLGNITDTDLVLIAKCEIVAPEGMHVQGFGSGQAISVDAVDFAEDRMGVDGHYVAGYKPVIRPITITLLPTSPFLGVVRACIAVQYMIPRMLRWDMQLRYPSIDKNYNMENGILFNGRDVPEAKNTLDDIPLVFHFARIKVM